MSNQIFRKYIDIINEAEQVDENFGFGKSKTPKAGDINVVASKLVFKPTTKLPLEYTYIPDVMNDLPNMPRMSYGVNTRGPGRLNTFTSDDDDKETRNTTMVQGDIIMSGPSEEQYVIKGDKFNKLYTGGIGNTIIPEQSPRMVALYTGEPMSFTAPWGDSMIIKPGDWLVKDGDKSYYRIAKKEFKQTYNVPK